MRRPRLTVDLDAICGNWRRLAREAEPAETAAVVKADAYGCGMARIAPALRGVGARTFFVATAEEGTALREVLGPGPVVYVMNGATGEELAMLREREVRPVLCSPEQCREAARFAAAGGRLRCGVQLDSGMNRLGLSLSEAEAFAREAAASLDVRLLMSHLGSAEEPGHPANLRQLERFEGVARALAGRFPDARRSLAATAGIFLGRRYHCGLVRPGIGLYGGRPFARGVPAVHLAAPVLQVRKVAAGETLGYGRAWRAVRESVIATLPIGYADGLVRALGCGRGRVRVGGTWAPVAGRVNMDLVTVDVTEVADVAPGAVAEILCEERGIDDVAEDAGTIAHEVLTSLRGARFERAYSGAGGEA